MNQDTGELKSTASAGQLEQPVMPEQIGEILAAIITSSDKELIELSEVELSGKWYWRWDESCSIGWNTYKFSDELEAHKRRCRRWEEKHNGSCCVVERVRDKYLMPRLREFVAELMTYNAANP